MTQPRDSARAREYWRRNVRYLAVLLTIWAAVSFGAGIVWADTLNRVRIPGTGFQLGFWFAQQGSIYVFLVLIAAYVWLMNRLDREMGVEERPRVAVLSRGEPGAAPGADAASEPPHAGRGGA